VVSSSPIWNSTERTPSPFSNGSSWLHVTGLVLIFLTGIVDTFVKRCRRFNQRRTNKYHFTSLVLTKSINRKH
jgi:uncharacterized membrane protein